MSYGVYPECKDSNIAIENILNEKKGHCYLRRLHCRSPLWKKTSYSSNPIKKSKKEGARNI